MLALAPLAQASSQGPSALATKTQLQAWEKQTQTKRKTDTEANIKEADHSPQTWRVPQHKYQYTLRNRHTMSLKIDLDTEETE